MKSFTLPEKQNKTLRLNYNEDNAPHFKENLLDNIFDIGDLYQLEKTIKNQFYHDDGNSNKKNHPKNNKVDLFNMLSTILVNPECYLFYDLQDKHFSVSDRFIDDIIAMIDSQIDALINQSEMSALLPYGNTPELQHRKIEIIQQLAKIIQRISHGGRSH